MKQNLPRFQAVLPPDVQVAYQFDQSGYVTRSIGGLLLEGALGAALTALMVLLFLRDGRSVLIVVVNIPLSLPALLLLWMTGQTVNLMTLGGLALAVGILVDEATVAVEDIHTHLRQGKDVCRAARNATAETALPRFLAMLSSSRSSSIGSMVGATKALFVPLSLSVGFAMMASFVLSSTLVPILAARFLRSEGHPSLDTGTYESVVRGNGAPARRPVVPLYLLVTVLVVVAGLGMLGTDLPRRGCRTSCNCG